MPREPRISATAPFQLSAAYSRTGGIAISSCPKQIDKAIIKHATELLVRALTAHVIARAPAP